MYVESLSIPCLDEGSNPSDSTKEIKNPASAGFFLLKNSACQSISGRGFAEGAAHGVIPPTSLKN